MCFYFHQSKTAVEIAHRYNSKTEPHKQNLQEVFTGFSHPLITTIHLQKSIPTIRHMQWGLIPHWAKSNEIQKNTLNARWETIHEKPSFKYYTQNRCIIPATGFYEWQWLDSKGKQKQKYDIRCSDNELFSLAGIWNIWHNNNQNIWTCSILTIPANSLMEKIHNTKQRMPFILDISQESDWLQGNTIAPKNIELIAIPCK